MIAVLVSTKFAGHDSLFFCSLGLSMMGSTGKTTDGYFQGANENQGNIAVHAMTPVSRFVQVVGDRHGCYVVHFSWFSMQA